MSRYREETYTAKRYGKSEWFYENGLPVPPHVAEVIDEHYDRIMREQMKEPTK